MASCVSIRVCQETILCRIPRYRHGFYGLSTRRLSFGASSCSTTSQLTRHFEQHCILATSSYMPLLYAAFAPLFRGFGKDIYQWLVSVHLGMMARTTDGVYDSLLVGVLYVCWRRYIHSRRARRDTRGHEPTLHRAVMKITKPYVEKLVAILTSRELAVNAV